MPLYDYACRICGKTLNLLASHDENPPLCCGVNMNKVFDGSCLIKDKYPLWVDRIEEIHKRQNDKGERRSLVHPREVLS
jgi:putative FmdB family regulatory protein